MLLQPQTPVEGLVCVLETLYGGYRISGIFELQKPLWSYIYKDDALYIFQC